MGGMGAVGLQIKLRFGLWRIVASLNASQTIAEPRIASIPSESAVELTTVAGSRLINAIHMGTETVAETLAVVSV